MSGWVHTPELFVVLHGCFRSGLRENAFRLPTLAERIAAAAAAAAAAAEDRLHLALPNKAAKNVKASAAKMNKATKTLMQKKAAAAKTKAAAQLFEECFSAGATGGPHGFRHAVLPASGLEPPQLGSL